MTSEYRPAPGLLLRAFGVLVGAAGVVLVLVALAVALLGWPSGVLTGAVVVGAITVVVLALAGLVVRRTVVVRLDDAGYRLRLLRGAGTKQARWRDVEDLVTAEVRGTRAVVVRLRDGTTTTVPVAVLDSGAERFVEDVRARLDRAHGYRRLR